MNISSYTYNPEEINIETIFLSPGIIIKDLFDLYKSNKPVNKRDSVLIHYFQLLFHKIWDIVYTYHRYYLIIIIF